MKHKYFSLDDIFSGYIFKLLYLILVLLSFNAYTEQSVLMKYFVLIVTFFGALNCMYRIFHYKQFIKMPFIILGCLFISSYFATILLNVRYGLMESIQGLVWMTFQILLLYCCDMKMPIDKIKVEFKKISLVFITYITLACAVSLVMLIKNYGEIFVLDAENYIQRGFVWGRLWGVFSDPNLGSVSVCINMMLCLFFLYKKTKWYQKLAIVISLVVSYFYLVFSDSRTGYVALFCSLFVWLYVKFSVKNRPNVQEAEKRILVRRILAVTMSLFIAVGTVASIIATKELYNFAISYQHDSTPSNKLDMEIKRSSNEEKNDFSNRRFDLWQSGFELFKTSPIVGVGFRNIQAAAADKTPNSYLINNSAGKFDAFHNMWIDILVSQGIIGFIIFGTLALCCMVSTLILLNILRKRKSNDIALYATLVSAIVPPLVCSLFQADTMYVNTPNAIMFWLLLGYLMKFFSYEKSSNKLSQSEFQAITEVAT